MVAISNNPAISNAASSALGQTQGRGMDALGHCIEGFFRP